jgi:hypothetical protein
VIGLAKAFKMLTLASNRTEAKLVSDISFVDVGGRYDTSPPVEHPNHTFTVFLFHK